MRSRTRRWWLVRAVGVLGVPFVAAAASAQAVPVDLAEVQGDIGATLHAAFSRYAEYGFSGVVLVEKSGRCILHAAYGWADRESERPMTTDVPLNIQSTTKPVVASLAVDLVADGLLSLDDELGAAFPDLPSIHRAVTLRKLLSHSSGLTRDYNASRDGPLATREDALRIFSSIDLAEEPDFAYRNLNYAVVKAWIERVTGEDFRVLLQSRVLTPAESDMVFQAPSQAAAAYDGMPGRYTPAIPSPQAETYAGGTLWGTAEGLARWEHFIDRGGLFPRAWLDTIRAPVAGDYGLGWFVYPGGMLYHGGDGGGFQSTIVRHPRLDDLFFVGLMNVRPNARDLWWRNAVMKAVQFAAAGRSFELPPPRFDTTVAAAWEGAYLTATGDSIAIHRDPADGGLVVSAFGPQAVSGLHSTDAEWLPLLRAADERSERIGRWLAGGDPPGDDVVSSEDRTRFIQFLAEYAEQLAEPPLDRWEVLGTIQRSNTSMQTFVATDDETVRLTWSADDLRLVGWGLGGETPGAFPAGVSPDGDLVAYVPARDETIAVRASLRREGRVEGIEVGGVTAVRIGREESRGPTPPAIDSLIAQFDRTPIVALAEEHRSARVHDFLLKLLRDPRFAEHLTLIRRRRRPPDSGKMLRLRRLRGRLAASGWLDARVCNRQ